MCQTKRNGCEENRIWGLHVACTLVSDLTAAAESGLDEEALAGLLREGGFLVIN